MRKYMDKEFSVYCYVLNFMLPAPAQRPRFTQVTCTKEVGLSCCIVQFPHCLHIRNGHYV